MKLLIEIADPKSLQIIKEDIEEQGEKKKVYFLKGPMIGCGVVNRNGRKYPIILMSGDPCNKPLVNIIKYSGNWRYLDKPVDIHRFYEKAEELFGKAEE